MSRSYREPWYVDTYGCRCKRWMKRQASRAVRRSKEVPSGKAYRKYYNPYDICDFKYRWTGESFIYWNKFGEPEWVPVSSDPEWRARRK